MDAIVSMSGRLGTDVETRISRNGKEYTKFRLATSPRLFREGAWADGPTTWVSVRCYGNLATHTMLSLRKGHPVVVVGKLRVEEWPNDQGVVRETTVLEAQSVGHDLNWCVSRYSKLERERSEPDIAPVGEGPDPDEGITDDELLEPAFAQPAA